MAAVLPVSSDG